MDATDDEFLRFADGSSIADQVRMLEARCAGRRVVVFAHSIGAVPAVIAARELDLATLVLVEPALYDVARGHPAIERHIGVVTEARSRAATDDLRGFWALLRPLMFGGPFDENRWDEERAVAEHWAHTNLPWGHDARAQMIDRIPTLVVTGDWNEEYEHIARVLREHGAMHEVVSGCGHRPQDSVRFREVIGAFAASESPS